METIAGWIAPIATILASMMTAANLGPRITGWGFVVFTVGSIGWIVIAFLSDQQNLLWSNGFLTIVNLIGIWRWLGREAKLNDGASGAKGDSHKDDRITLFSASEMIDGPVFDRDGRSIATMAGAMIAAGTGRLAYCVVREGGIAGIGERLHAIPWDAVDASNGRITLCMTAQDLGALPTIEADSWPSQVPPIA